MYTHRHTHLYIQRKSSGRLQTKELPGFLQGVVLRRLFLYTSAWLGFLFFFFTGASVRSFCNYEDELLCCLQDSVMQKGCRLPEHLVMASKALPRGSHHTARCLPECTPQCHASLSPVLPELSPIHAKAAAASSGRCIRIRFS